MYNFFKKHHLHFFAGVAIIVLFILIWSWIKNSSSTNEVSLFFSPSKSIVTVGDTITISLSLSAPGQSINAAEGEVVFLSDKIEIVEIDKADSIFTIWAEEPNILKATTTATTISFAGVLTRPGFTGMNGHIFKITFRAVQPGQVVFNLAKARVLANDGLGTNVLNDLRPAHFIIEEKPKISNQSDINNDGKITIRDVSILISNLGATGKTKADLNNDGVVNLSDLSILVANLLK